VPSPLNVLAGTSTDATTGSLTLPAVGNVRNAVDYGVGGVGSTGTLTLPSAGNVADGVHYGAGGTEYTGTLVASVAVPHVIGA
jgi:hypothetical protein